MYYMKYEIFSFLLFSSLLAIYFDNTSRIFGQEDQNQGLVRCSAGNLVRSLTECPSTDICHPSERLGTEVHCIPRQAPKALTSLQINSGEKEAISISTSKPTYVFGEIVNITIKNVGIDPLTFPNSILGLKIENAITHEKYPLFSAQVITTLDSGGSKSLKWNQKDSFGRQVEEGNYIASTSSGSLVANTTFSIVK
jgi:hypothetical protein